MFNAEDILSPREMETAVLIRLGLGRNAVSGLLGLSENSVKTVQKRIEKKLGKDWKKNPAISWPNPAEKYKDIEFPEEGRDEFDDGFYHWLEREKKRQLKARRISLLKIIKRSRPGRDILHVSSAQRFWLRPALKELEERRQVKLLAVDWNETFAPPWLPVVNRGRREIRAADYIAFNWQYVQGFLREYVDHDLKKRIFEINERLKEIRPAVKKEGIIPGLKELAAMALAELQRGA